jgi:hypothetical protein
VSNLSTSQTEVTSEFGNIKLDLKAAQSLSHCGSHIDDRIDNLVDLDELSEVRT